VIFSSSFFPPVFCFHHQLTVDPNSPDSVCNHQIDISTMIYLIDLYDTCHGEGGQGMTGVMLINA
jgi:hypothetical protein